MKITIDIDEAVIELGDIIRCIDELTELVPDYRLDEADEIREELFKRLDKLIK